MRDFELKLGSTMYKAHCSTGTSNGKPIISWDVTAEFNKFSFNIRVPKEKEATQEEIMVFICAFDEAFNIVRTKQRQTNDLRFLNN